MKNYLLLYSNILAIVYFEESLTSSKEQPLTILFEDDENWDGTSLIIYPPVNGAFALKCSS